MPESALLAAMRGSNPANGYNPFIKHVVTYLGANEAEVRRSLRFYPNPATGNEPLFWALAKALNPGSPATAANYLRSHIDMGRSIFDEPGRVSRWVEQYLSGV